MKPPSKFLPPPKPLSFGQQVGIVIGVELFFLGAADLVGAVACFLLDTFESSPGMAIIYTIWFVLGVFCGVLIYTAAGDAVSRKSKDWTAHPNALGTAWTIILTTAAILTAIAVGWYYKDWRYGDVDGIYVPGSRSVTLTFFVTIMVTMFLLDWAIRWSPKKPVSVAVDDDDDEDAEV